MTSKFGVVFLFSALSAAAALGATSATIEVTDPGTNVVGDFYIGPYQALVNGIPTQVICDDYLADTEVNVPWTATILSVADLSDPLNLAATRWGSAGATAETYRQAAWLATQLDDWTPSTPCLTGNCQADLQFAIWSLFDPSAYSYYFNNSPDPFTHVAAVGLWQLAAAASADTSGIDFSKVLIYTPNPIQGGPQEFLSVVHTPEPGSGVLLSIQALGVLGLVYFVRRRSAAQKH